jgi:hypothetical protein
MAHLWMLRGGGLRQGRRGPERHRDYSNDTPLGRSDDDDDAAIGFSGGGLVVYRLEPSIAVITSDHGLPVDRSVGPPRRAGKRLVKCPVGRR